MIAQPLSWTWWRCRYAWYVWRQRIGLGPIASWRAANRAVDQWAYGDSPEDAADTEISYMGS